MNKVLNVMLLLASSFWLFLGVVTFILIVKERFGMQQMSNKEMNILIGQKLGIERVLVDLPTGYAGIDYLENEETLDKAIKDMTRITLRFAARQVGGHWNDKVAMTNQYEQAKRSEAVLLKIAEDLK